MQKCKICGKQVKYIAIKRNAVVECDPNLLTFVTERGSIQKGYLKHNCEVKNAEDPKKFN